MREARVGFLACVSLVVANMIGTGVFTSLGFQVGSLPSGFAIVVLWAVGGVLAWCGATAYGELGGLFPRSGGEYRFLGETYHPCVGFMAGLVSLVAGFAAPVAAASEAFGSYAQGVWPGVSAKVAGAALIVAMALAHRVALHLSARVQVGFTALKVVLILIFLAVGLTRGEPQAVRWLPAREDVKLIFSGSFAVSLMFVMYAYSGWNAAAYILDEVRGGARTAGRALLTGTAFVAVLYVLLNVAFLRCAPMSELEGKVRVGHIAAEHVFGGSGAQMMSALICLGLVSTVSAMTWAGPRVAEAMGRDLAVFSWLVPRAGGVPDRAVLLQSAIALMLLVMGKFETVVLYSQVSLTLCTMLAVGGVIVMRWRRPEAERPLRCAGYPLTPCLFLAAGVFTLGWTLVNKPAAAGLGLGTTVAAVLIYPFVKRKTSPTS